LKSSSFGTVAPVGGPRVRVAFGGERRRPLEAKGLRSGCWGILGWKALGLILGELRRVGGSAMRLPMELSAVLGDFAGSFGSSGSCAGGAWGSLGACAGPPTKSCKFPKSIPPLVTL
jgi:hypothetical protein